MRSCDLKKLIVFASLRCKIAAISDYRRSSIQKSLGQTQFLVKATREELVDIIYQSLNRLNEQLPDGNQIQKSMDATLVGEGGGLDSLGLVNFIALIEEECANKYGTGVSLTDPPPHQDDRFANVGKFADFLFQRLNNSLL